MGSRIILLRHGQTPANVERKLDTALPGRLLTAHGRKQAETAGANLVGLCGAGNGSPGRLTAIVNSQATRARQTADIAAETFNKAAGLSGGTALVPETIGGIKEISAGDYEDQSSAEAFNVYLEHFGRMLHNDPTARVPGGESTSEFRNRYYGAVEQQIREKLRTQQETAVDGDLVMVSHGAAIRVFTAMATGVDPRFLVENYLDNCNFSVIEPTADGFGQWKLLSWATFDGEPIA